MPILFLAPSLSVSFAPLPDFGIRSKAIGPTMLVRPISLRLFGGNNEIWRGRQKSFGFLSEIHQLC